MNRVERAQLAGCECRRPTENCSGDAGKVEGAEEPLGFEGALGFGPREFHRANNLDGRELAGHDLALGDGSLERVGLRLPDD